MFIYHRLNFPKMVTYYPKQTSEIAYQTTRGANPRVLSESHAANIYRLVYGLSPHLSFVRCHSSIFEHREMPKTICLYDVLESEAQIEKINRESCLHSPLLLTTLSLK